MNIINDGQCLELRFDNYAKFSSVEEQRRTLDKLKKSNLPLRIVLNPKNNLSPVESGFFRNVININQKKGGRVLITSLSAPRELAS